MARRSHCRRRWYPCWRRGPRLSGEIKEVEQIRLGRIAVGQGRQAKALFHKVHDGRVVHRPMSHIMPSRKWRDNKVRHTEANLRAKTLMSCGGRICCMRPRTVGTQIAMVGINACRRRLAWQECVWIYRDRRHIALVGCQRRAGILICMPRHWRHMVIWPAALVKAEEHY